MTSSSINFCDDGKHHFQLQEGKSICRYCGLLYDAYRIYKEELEEKAKKEKIRRRLEKQKQVEQVNKEVSKS